jgi:hypothetical protein
MNYRVFVAMIAPLLGGCGATALNGEATTRLNALDVRIAVDERRAANLRADVLQQEASLRAQSACMSWAEGRARLARIDAEAAQALATCALRDAQFHRCEAEGSKHTAHGALIGCAIGGTAATLLSFGTLAPAVLAGCAAGLAAGHVTKEDCPSVEPNCDATARAAVTIAMQREGLQSLSSQPESMPPWCAAFGFH